jgi:hypothetical protein
MPADVWPVHRDALIAEAGAAGFQPFWATKKRPTGAKFERWRERFLREHSY